MVRTSLTTVILSGEPLEQIQQRIDQEQKAIIASAPPQPSFPPLPNYRKLVADKMRKDLYDPYSVHDAKISPLSVGYSREEAKWSQYVCVEYNAKNQMGGYTGIQTRVYVFTNGKAEMSGRHAGDVTAKGRTWCDAPAYVKFTEISQK
jgi:hypothetical protein